MKHEYHAGDRVVFRFRWWDDCKDHEDIYSYRGFQTGIRREGIVECAARNGKLVKIKFNDLHGHEKHVWRRAWRVALIEAAKPVASRRPAVVDARVLEEITAIQQSLGSTEALLDLLRDIRKTYGKAAED